jgi:uroporphyrinogen decarboxylase
MDCLQALEVKAGMDMLRLFRQYGTHITFCGNIDVRTLLANDNAKTEAEVRRKVEPVIMNGGGYILHSDHSIPPQVNYDTFSYFAGLRNVFTCQKALTR